MNTLYLLRHGDAPHARGETDADRKLNSLGYSESEKVAKYLNAHQLQITHIVSSDSIRTRQTVGKILETYQYKPDITFTPKLYNASGHEILECINAQASKNNSLMIVGHNPGITSVIDLIHCSGDSESVIKSRNFEITCKLVKISFDSNDWRDLGISQAAIESVFFPTD